MVRQWVFVFIVLWSLEGDNGHERDRAERPLLCLFVIVSVLFDVLLSLCVRLEVLLFFPSGLARELTNFRGTDN